MHMKLAFNMPLVQEIGGEKLEEIGKSLSCNVVVEK